MDIKTADFNDIPELVSLINSAYRGDTSKKGWTTEADLLDGTRTDEANIGEMMNDKNSVFLKCMDESGKINGCVYLQKQSTKIYLGMLTVSPELQGAGIGKRLLSAAVEHAKSMNCPAIFMTVISVRRELIEWYERHGYRKTGEKRPFPVGEKFGIQKQPLELILLEKSI
ncbi:MAG TPA: GNAT family N-acetyltransferase [Puia sp.]|nr:GNAT family N-acetyltransferase [Puia sp.]